MPWLLDPLVSDGERVARPFARVVVADAPDVEDVAGGLVEVGIVGRRPLDTDEPEARRPADPAIMVRACRDAAVDAEPLRSFYRTWFASNGEPGREVAERHPAVEQWATASGPRRQGPAARWWRRRSR